MQNATSSAANTQPIERRLATIMTADVAGYSRNTISASGNWSNGAPITASLTRAR